MPIPSLTIGIQDPGIGAVETADRTLCVIGCARKGTNLARMWGSPDAVISEYGDGPLVEDLCHALLIAGGPVMGIRISSTVASTNTAVTKVASGTSTGTITVAGTAHDAFDVIVAITETGALNVGRFAFSLDGGANYSEPITIPLAGTYAVPRTGLTLTFVPGAGPVIFERGDTHSFSSTNPHYSSTEVAAGFAQLSAYLSTAPATVIDGVLLSGANATGAGAATIAATLNAQLMSQETFGRFFWGMLDAGNDGRAAVKAALAAFAGTRTLPVYGRAVAASGAPRVGLGNPWGPAARVAFARAGVALLSEDLARVASGPLESVTAISWDEASAPEMDDARISTLRTWPGKPGFYVTNARIKSAPGSDYRFLQHRRVIDEACRISWLGLLEYSSGEFLTKKDGTIEDEEAERVEAVVGEALKQALLKPANASGRAGHASAVSIRIDRTVNLVTTDKLVAKVAVRPLGYAKFIEATVGLALNVGG